MQALLLSTLSALIACLSYLLLAQPASIMPTPARNQLGVLASRAEWQQALDSLPDAASLNGRIPSFFFAHGHPTLLWPKDLHNSREGLVCGVWSLGLLSSVGAQCCLSISSERSPNRKGFYANSSATLEKHYCRSQFSETQ